MRKAISVVVTIAIAGVFSVMLVSCSSGGGSSSSTASTTSSASSPASAEVSSSAAAGSLFDAGEWPEGAAGQIVPKPSFSYAPSDIHETDRSAIIQYSQADEAEVAAWVDEVKNAGFTVDASESKGTTYSYMARNGNKDMVSITLRQSDEVQPKLLIQLSIY